MSEAPKCVFCEASMHLSRDRWLCGECGWWLPNKSLCPTCWSSLPEEEGPGGERICRHCRTEVWPPRDEPPEPREVWYHPPGMEPYKVGKPRSISLAGPPKRKGGSRKKTRQKSPMMQKWEAWKRGGGWRKYHQ